MKKLIILLAAILVLSTKTVIAQLIVTPVTIQQLQVIQNMLGGNNALISNITYNNSSDTVVWNNIGIFTTGSTPTNLGLTNGLILGTGGVVGAVGPNNSSSYTLDVSPSTPDLSDSDLVALVPGSTLHDAAILEFDFKLMTDTFKFRFVFGSEEYPEFVNEFDDVFGFFVTGTNPSGGMYNKQNIALIPGTTLPISINTINNGTANNGPCVNCAYYINNTGGTSLQADTFTTVLTAWCLVVPCETYHFKIAIADNLDRVWDSWVWLDTSPPSSGMGNLTGSSNVCTGENVLYSLPNTTYFSQYNWSLPNGATGSSDSTSIVVNFGSNAQSGLVTVSGVSSCGLDTLASFLVTVNPTPVQPVITMSNDTLFSNAFMGNQWYNLNGILTGATNQFYIYTPTSDYYDIVTINGCSSLVSDTIFFTDAGIKGNNKIETIRIYPNPAKDNITIETNSDKEQRIEIIDLVGQTVYTNIINNKETINTSAFAKGVYILKIYSNKETIVRKFLKQ